MAVGDDILHEDSFGHVARGSEFSTHGRQVALILVYAFFRGRGSSSRVAVMQAEELESASAGAGCTSNCQHHRPYPACSLLPKRKQPEACTRERGCS